MNQRIEKSQAIYEHWRAGDGDMNELAIGLYDLTADYETLLDDYEKLEVKAQELDALIAVYDLTQRDVDKAVIKFDAAQENDLSKLPTQQKLTEEDMEATT